MATNPHRRMTVSHHFPSEGFGQRVTNWLTPWFQSITGAFEATCVPKPDTVSDAGVPTPSLEESYSGAATRREGSREQNIVSVSVVQPSETAFVTTRHATPETSVPIVTSNGRQQQCFADVAMLDATQRQQRRQENTSSWNTKRNLASCRRHNRLSRPFRASVIRQHHVKVPRMVARLRCQRSRLRYRHGCCGQNAFSVFPFLPLPLDAPPTSLTLSSCMRMPDTLLPETSSNDDLVDQQKLSATSCCDVPHQTTEGPMPFHVLFEIMRDHIWPFLSLVDIGRLSATGSRLLLLCDDEDRFWRQVYQRDVVLNLSRHGFVPCSNVGILEKRYSANDAERALEGCGGSCFLSEKPAGCLGLPFVSDYKLLILDEFVLVQQEKLDIVDERIHLIEEMNEFRQQLCRLLEQCTSPAVEEQLHLLLAVRPDRTAELLDVKCNVRPGIECDAERLRSSIRSAMRRRRYSHHQGHAPTEKTEP